MIKNPYRREKLNKQFWGKTSEERKANRAAFKEAMLAHKQLVDREAAEKEIYDAEVVAKEVAKKRQQIAKTRKEIGFDDKGAEEMDDEVLESI